MLIDYICFDIFELIAAYLPPSDLFALYNVSRALRVAARESTKTRTINAACSCEDTTVDWRILSTVVKTVTVHKPLEELFDIISDPTTVSTEWWLGKIVVNAVALRSPLITDACAFEIATRNPQTESISFIDCSTTTADAIVGVARGCRNLKSIFVSNNKMRLRAVDLTSHFSALAHYCTNLESISLNGVKCINISEMVIGCPKLKSISISNTQVFDLALAGMLALHCKSVEQITLDKVSVTNIALLIVSFGDCVQLKSFTLVSRNHHGIIHKEYAAKYTNLETLILDDTMLGDGAVDFAVSCPKLKFVSMNRTNLTDAGLLKFALSKTITRVSWTGCANITDRGTSAYFAAMNARNVAASG